jgi:hypothetical protein
MSNNKWHFSYDPKHDLTVAISSYTQKSEDNLTKTLYTFNHLERKLAFKVFHIAYLLSLIEVQD